MTPEWAFLLGIAAALVILALLGGKKK